MPPPAPAPGGIGQPADVLPRFLARLIDYILLGVVNAFIATVVVATVIGTNPGALSGFGMDTGSGWAARAVSTLISTAITLGYFTLMESSRGQTVGKMIVKLETRGPTGGRPTTQEALKRNAFTAIGVLGVVPFLGFLSGLLGLVAVIMIAVTISQNTATRQGWHDNFAGGTTVVRVG